MAKITVHNGTTEYTCYSLPAETIHGVLVRKGIVIHAPCGGRRTCKKCKVQIQGNCSYPTPGELEFLSDQELLSGVRLACMAVPMGDCDVTLFSEEVNHQQTLAPILPVTSKKGLVCGIDIGTTTVVVYLYRGADGVCLGSLAKQNAQATFGADVISRIQGATTLKALPLIQKATTTQLSQMITEVCEGAKVTCDQITFCTIAANTTMLHFLTGLDPSSLAVAPFTPLSLFGTMYRGEQLNLPLSCDVYCIPCVSAYVGGDITAGIAACEMDLQNKTTLLIDVGTNGEMAIKKKDSDTIYTLATAAGPAFEGAHITHGVGGIDGAICKIEQGVVSTINNAPPIGICGSGLLDAIAMMVNEEIIEESGYLEDDFPITPDGKIVITPKDVREVQLAKSAICSGVIRLMELSQVKPEEVDCVYFAGGFGNHLNPKSAATIGLIPPSLADKCQGVGNTAGLGAVKAALDDSFLERLEQLPLQITYFELSGDARFNQLFMENMIFEG